MSRIFCSLFDKAVWKDSIVRVKELFSPEWVATSSTAEFLKTLGCRVVSLEELGIKANYLGGKVKSLHPAVYAAVMVDANNTTELKELRGENIQPFDAVMVDIYKLGQGSAFEPKQIDIGGPSILRAASKNYENCLPICHPEILGQLLSASPPKKGQDFSQWKSTLSTDLKKRCAIDVFLMMQDVNQQIATEMLAKHSTAALTYGDNPKETAALNSHPFWDHQQRILPVQLDDTRILRHPAEMKFSWNNVMDIHQALSLFRWIQAPCRAAIMKHHHTCGVGYGSDTIESAFEKSHACDPLSAFGGVVVLNQVPSPKFIEGLKGKFIDLLVIPTGSETFFKTLVQERPTQRVIALPMEQLPSQAFDHQHHRTIFGDIQLQKWQSLAAALNEKNWTVHEGKQRLTPEIKAVLKNALTVVAHLHSNAIVIADQRGSLGMGVGFVNRVDAIRHAVSAAKSKPVEGPLVLASDGFMPFADNIEATAAIPVQAVIQPGGSKKDAEVIAACQKRGITLVVTGHRVFFHGV